MPKKIVHVLLGGYAVVLVLVLTRPTGYRIERSVDIAAPPELVWALLRDPRRAGTWSPWSPNRVEPALHGIDPAMMDHCTTLSIVGSNGGKGTHLSWHRSGSLGLGKVLSLLTGVDWLVNEEFEQGLLGFKRLAESDARRRTEVGDAP